MTSRVEDAHTCEAWGASWYWETAGVHLGTDQFRLRDASIQWKGDWGLVTTILCVHESLGRLRKFGCGRDVRRDRDGDPGMNKRDGHSRMELQKTLHQEALGLHVGTNGL